jgi:predicted Zn-dependent protease
MLYTREDEIELDHKVSPHQLSADYGAIQDDALNRYVTEIAQGMVAICHRPDMPYTFRVINASYVNGYTFPAGTVSLTRGLMLAMEDESQLAAVLGHEITHVCARHTSSRLTSQLLVLGTLAGAVILLDDKHAKWEPWVIGLGYIGAGFLLAHYSRDDERMADEYGLQYMVKAGHNPGGMAALMDIFRQMSKGKMPAILRWLSTHPMSEERYQTAIQRADNLYAAEKGRDLGRTRYKDMTARLRKLRAVVDACQDGDAQVDAKRYDRAVGLYQKALAMAPDDYEALLKCANALSLMDLPAQALPYTEQARAAYPAEPQALHMRGMVRIRMAQYDAALEDFTKYAGMLPGNPFTLFQKGHALDGMGRKTEAAEAYQAFLEDDPGGQESVHARLRLQEWGYAAPEPTPSLF